MVAVPNNILYLAALDCIGAVRAASGSTTSLALNAAYVHLTSGTAMALRYFAMTADPIDELYVYIAAATVTPGTLRARIYNEQAGQPVRPGSTQRGGNGTTADALLADRFIKITFASPYTPAIGEMLWIVIDNTDATPATNNFSLHTAITPTYLTGTVGNYNVSQFYSNTAGFTTNGTSAARCPWIIKQGSNYFGWPWNSLGTNPIPSNTRKKGIKFTPRKTVRLLGYDTDGGSTSHVKLQIFGPGQLPNDTPLYEFNLDTDANQTQNDVIGSKIFATQPILYGGTEYRAVFTIAVSLGLTTSGLIGVNGLSYPGSAYESVIDAVRLADTHRYPVGTEDSGSNTWIDYKGTCPGIRMLISDYVNDPSFSGFIGG